MPISIPDATFRQAQNLMWVYDAHTFEVLDANDLACQTYGYRPDEFIGLDVRHLLPLEDRESFAGFVSDTPLANRHLTHQGGEIFVRCSEFPVEYNGRPSVLSMALDMTSSVQLEADKQELLHRYQALTEAANDLLWVWDIDKDLVTLNEALITQYGYTRDDLVQPLGWWAEKIHPEDYSAASWSVQEALNEKRNYWTAEYRFQKADGSYVPVLDRGILHVDDEGKPIRMIGAIVDLTQRSAAEDERDQLFRLSVDCMLFLDTTGEIIQANRAFYDLAGLGPDEVKSRKFCAFLPKADSEALTIEATRLLESGGQVQFTSGLAGGEHEGRTVSWRMITNEARSRVFLVGRDITATIAAQRELEAALDTSQRLALEAQAARLAQTEFLQNMSHELRTPMNGILGTALLAASTHDERQRSLATILVRSGESLLQILNDILDFSKIESGMITLERTSFQLDEVVQTVFDLFTLSAKHKNLAFTMAIGPEAQVAVLGDSFRLRQAVSNLVGNAIKFTDKGAISLVLDVFPKGDELEAVILIRDTGIGVPKSMQDRIFERFVQVDSSITRRHGGTGLGLSLAKTFVELMGGSISMESRLGHGSTFTLRIPFERSQMAKSSPEINLAPVRCRREGTRVLVAEDVEVNALILTTWLEQRGFECTIVTNGRAAIDALSREAYDGAFLDLHMPEASGYDVLASVRANERPGTTRLPIVAVTASVSKEERTRCAEEGFDDYIPKPIVVSDLDRVVARLF